MNFWVYILIAAIIVCFIIYALIPNKREYVCQKCNKTFKPTKFQLIKTTHVWNSFLLKCPYCGKKSMMPPAPRK